MSAPAPAPTPEELVRDGIPPALVEWHRERARVLRAQEIARLGRALATWLHSLRPAAPLAPRDAAP